MSARILVVDDDDDIREMVCMALEVNGYRVASAVDGVDALECLERDGGIGLVLLDLMMPRMDGERFLQAHRAGAHARVPVVILSGHGAAQDKAKELAADGCLGKPVDLAELVGAVEKLLPR